ncbi:hypothetical protein Bca52824_026283 [Brassica carinata]|uniref:Uncharacterized protein n=1 Tax=Brassica carinata TaxID=52824 RepID=A0A8X7SJG0_BRACI|nr:hypothetical protein Bca52824_026283 [Brassica carinata]
MALIWMRHLENQDDLLKEAHKNLVTRTSETHGSLEDLRDILHTNQGGDHSADDVMPGENPVASKVSDGDNKTDVELPDSVSGELGESTNANHQPSSSVVPGGRSSCINQTG